MIQGWIAEQVARERQREMAGGVAMERHLDGHSATSQRVKARRAVRESRSFTASALVALSIRGWSVR